jgi:uncharacterized membrane protein
MKKLLKKELLLCANPQLIIFCLLGALVCVPSWPSMIAMIYILSGLTTIFPRALADQDTQYTAMLPIRKKDVVSGKASFIIFLELASILISVPFALLKIFLIDPNSIASSNAAGDTGNASYLLAVQPTLGAYGYVLVAFAVFNLVLFPWYYKNPAKVNWPPVVSFFVALLVMAGGIGAEVGVYFAMGGDRSSSSYWLYEGLVMGLGILLFILLSFLAIKKAQKNFEKVDL